MLHKEKLGRGAVLVWIHGGSYTAGGIGPLVGVFNGSSNVALADDLIIVTVQYRLGILGFAGSSGLTGRNADGSTGNYGIQDQRAAMAWVSTPTEGFGGNASNVMIVGESAGAGSESMHLTMPESFGYYSKVGLESGAWSCWTAQPMSEARLVVHHVARILDRVGILRCDPGFCFSWHAIAS